MKRGRPPKRYVADRRRHLWTAGGRDSLLAMADDLDIPRHWLHRGGVLEHVDIPVLQVTRVLADPRVRVVSSPRELLRVAKK
jgi:hypothetical protein